MPLQAKQVQPLYDSIFLHQQQRRRYSNSRSLYRQQRDRTVDDDGVIPDVEDAIAVTCRSIIAREQFGRVAAISTTGNPGRMAPHVAAGTTLPTGVARCGMPGCSSGMTIRTGKVAAIPTISATTR